MTKLVSENGGTEPGESVMPALSLGQAAVWACAGIAAANVAMKAAAGMSEDSPPLIF